MNPIIQKIKSVVHDTVPDARVILFGSCARGEEHKESDIDLVIILKRTANYSEQQKITTPLYDLEIESGFIISPKVFSENDWNGKYSITPFYENVMREGIEL